MELDVVEESQVSLEGGCADSWWMLKNLSVQGWRRLIRVGSRIIGIIS